MYIELTERTVLLNYIKIKQDTNLKIIILNYLNNYIEDSNWLLEC